MYMQDFCGDNHGSSVQGTALPNPSRFHPVLVGPVALALAESGDISGCMTHLSQAVKAGVQPPLSAFEDILHCFDTQSASDLPDQEHHVQSWRTGKRPLHRRHRPHSDDPKHGKTGLKQAVLHFDDSVARRWCFRAETIVSLMGRCSCEPSVTTYMLVMRIIDRCCRGPDRALDFFYSHQSRLRSLSDVACMHSFAIQLCARHRGKKAVVTSLRSSLKHVQAVISSRQAAPEQLDFQEKLGYFSVTHSVTAAKDAQS